MNAALRAGDIKSLIPQPPSDLAPLRMAFSGMVAGQWRKHLGTLPLPSGKARFIAEMYARACYSMLLLSCHGPALLRLPRGFVSQLPLSRARAIHLGRALLSSLPRLVPQEFNRRLLLMSALMGTLDVVLDESASLGEAAVLHVASLLTDLTPSTSNPAEQQIAALTGMARRKERVQQSEYWDAVVIPAVRSYCQAEALAVMHARDPQNMAHRGAGIDCALKGMWYASGYLETDRNREQRWMADTALLMQMIDDWVDQDEDRGIRITPALTGAWNLQSVKQLYEKTVYELSAMLEENGIRGKVARQLFLDLYNDYLHVALNAMSTGVAA